MMKTRLITLLLVAGMLTACNNKETNNQTSNNNMKTTLQLTEEWDKTFPKSDKVDHKKVTFHNRYGIELAADMYTPKNAEGKLAAIAVSGPFGAVKEQSSGLYAQHMAERGYLTIAFDPSFTGESGGEPRRMASPDINTEDFLAAVDFLSVQDNVDPERIGIIGICGFGGMAVNAAAKVRTHHNSVWKNARHWLLNVLPIIRLVAISVLAVLSTRCLKMPPGLSRIIMPTTKQSAATTSAVATQMTDGIRSVASHSSTSPSLHGHRR